MCIVGCGVSLGCSCRCLERKREYGFRRYAQNPTASAESGEAGTVDFSFASPEEMLGNMKAVSENNRFILYYSKNNLSVALLEKSSGRIYSTNPYNGSADESNVGNVEKSLESQVIISYIDVNERQQKLDMYSSADCVELGQFSYTEYADGVSFDMSLGKESGIRLVPAALTEARFNEITSKLEGTPCQAHERLLYKIFLG